VSESGWPVQYRVETTTTDNALRDASIVFEGPDLEPVSLRLVFDSGGWVEISAIPESPATAPAVLDRAPAKDPDVAEPRLTDRRLAERELAVRMAVDALSNNAPAPVTVEVAPEGSIIVTPYRLLPEQERQLSENLAGKEGVLLNPMERDSGPIAGSVSAGDE
jgi:hypothetical protein